MLTNNSKIALSVSLAIGVVISFWSLVTPIFEFPDEQAHFSSVEFLLKNKRMPAGLESDMTPELKQTQELLGVYRNPSGQNKYTYHPEYRVDYSDSTTGIYENEIISISTEGLRSTYIATEAARYPRAYYDYESFWNRLVISSDIFTRLFVTRLGAFALTVAMTFFVWQAGLLIFKKKSYATTLTILVMLQPMFSFVSAGINSDNLHNLLFTIGIYLSLLIIEKGFSFSVLAFLALTLGLDVYAKPQGVTLIVLVGLSIVMRAWITRNWRVMVGLLIFGSIGVYLARTALLPYFGFMNIANVRGDSFVEFLRFSSNKLMAQNIVWYWGVFKWLGVVLPPIYWRVANRVVLISAIGLIVYAWKVIKSKKVIANPSAIVFLLLSVIVYTLSIFWFDWQYVKWQGFSLGIQARYFFPTIISQMALLMTGIISFGWNDKVKRYLLGGLVLLFIWLQLGGIWTLLSSYYDMSSLSNFITQISQYKPDFAKGEIWYLWIALYLLSILYLLSKVFLIKPKVSK